MKRVDRLRHVGIGLKLQRARERSGLTTRAVATKLGTSPASVSRTENSRRLPSPEEAAALCGLYGLTGADKRQLLDQLTEAADTESWLAHGDIPDELASLMELERRAGTIISAQASLVPGLLQTAEYARLVIAPVAGGDELERRVALRMARQTLLSRPSSPAVSFFLEEGALHRTLGEPQVMRVQLEHLRLLQRRQNISVRVIRADTPSPANGIPFTLHKLGTDTYVFVEAGNVGVFVTDDANVGHFVKICRGLDEAALDEQGSSELIARIAEGLDDGRADVAHE